MLCSIRPQNQMNYFNFSSTARFFTVQKFVPYHIDKDRVIEKDIKYI